MSNKKPDLKSQYENYIGGQWTAPVDGEYFENTSPVDGQVLTNIPRSNKKEALYEIKWVMYNSPYE